MENGVCCAAARSAAVKRAAMAPGPKNDFMMSTPEVEVDFQSAYRSMRIRERKGQIASAKSAKKESRQIAMVWC